MQKNPLEKIYDSKLFEDTIYERWEASGYFNPDNLKNAKEPFTISMPPPNATGTLHIGHSMTLVLQDLMIRYNRMKGKKTLWLPGTDHASIATQNKVEKLIAKEGKTRHDLGRELFIERVKAFVELSRGTIRNQIRKMGSSCDWSRERYTLDSGLSKAVNEAFVRMHADGLIYRDYRIVNWCPRCVSTLSDDEVIHSPETGKLYFISYPVKDSAELITVATTRPETMLGDMAIAVNPEDPRYTHLIGTIAIVPLIGREIPIISDPYVEKDFGTGALKITPAHDPNDFVLGKKYHLQMRRILSETGIIDFSELHKEGLDLTIAAKLEGMDRSAARDAIVSLLTEHANLQKTEDLQHSVGSCYRCDTVIEPYISLQWFVGVDLPIKSLGKTTLKELSLDTVQSGKTKITPKRFEKIYFHWVNNLHDWCISRQIWFGHQLPVYYCFRENNGCGATIVSVEEPKSCSKCKNEELVRDPDTLDTWFSSGLWTFSSLGWPDNIELKRGKAIKKGDLATYHPTSVLETGYDILSFWVARMILMSRYCMHEEPFQNVYLHGMVLDKDGKKMSKSKEETIIDPLDMIEKYGADALRLSMLVGVTPGNDVRLSEDKIASYRNFVNKLWNISRYIIEFGLADMTPPTKKLTLADTWIISRCEQTIADVTRLIDKFQFSQAAELLRVFTWDDLADWYLEVAKIEKGKQQILLWIFEQLLALWHPFTPFITEVLYRHLPPAADKKHPRPELLMIHPWPSVDKKRISAASITHFERLKGLIQVIRNARAENNISPAQKIQCYFVSQQSSDLILENSDVIKYLARLDFIALIDNNEHPANALYLKVEDIEIYLPLGMMKMEEEQARLTKEGERLSALIQGISAHLHQGDFVSRAPKAIVEKERAKLAEYEAALLKTQEQLKKLS